MNRNDIESNDKWIDYYIIIVFFFFIIILLALIVSYKEKYEWIKDGEYFFENSITLLVLIVSTLQTRRIQKDNSRQTLELQEENKKLAIRPIVNVKVPPKIICHISNGTVIDAISIKNYKTDGVRLRYLNDNTFDFNEVIELKNYSNENIAKNININFYTSGDTKELVDSSQIQWLVSNTSEYINLNYFISSKTINILKRKILMNFSSKRTYSSLENVYLHISYEDISGHPYTIKYMLMLTYNRRFADCAIIDLDLIPYLNNKYK